MLIVTYQMQLPWSCIKQDVAAQTAGLHQNFYCVYADKLHIGKQR